MKITYKRSQSSIELILLTSFLFFFFLLLINLAYKNLDEKSSQKNEIKLKDIAYKIQQEVDLAFSSSEGYKREFLIPENINGIEYEAKIIENMIYLKTIDERFSIALPVKNLTGEINISSNIIRKYQGVVYLNE